MSTYNCVVCRHPMDEVDDYTHVCYRCKRTEYTWHSLEEMDQS